MKLRPDLDPEPEKFSEHGAIWIFIWVLGPDLDPEPENLSDHGAIWIVIWVLPDRQTDNFIQRKLIYIVIQNGLQYNAHDSGYSNKQDKK